MSDPLKLLQLEVANHQMTVLRDEGVYRHIRFAEPGTMMWHFDLVTWPGHLVITGDVEDFHFARLDDMFEFFRSPVGYINPGYWAQKLRGPQKFKSFSEEILRRQVFQSFRWGTEWRDGPHQPLWRAICENVLSPDVAGSEDTARAALRDFCFVYDRPTVETPRDFVPQRIPRRARADTFEFEDWWEWDLTDYDYRFLLSLHAIVWGINQYDRACAVQAVAS